MKHIRTPCSSGRLHWPIARSVLDSTVLEHFYWLNGSHGVGTMVGDLASRDQTRLRCCLHPPLCDGVNQNFDDMSRCACNCTGMEKIRFVVASKYQPYPPPPSSFHRVLSVKPVTVTPYSDIYRFSLPRRSVLPVHLSFY